MKRSMTTLNALILFLGTNIGSVGLADSEKLICKWSDESALIKVSNNKIMVQMNGVSCLLESLSASGTGPYRIFSAEEKVCEWGDRFDVTTLAEIKVRFSGDSLDLNRPLIFNFVLSSDTGGHSTFSREFLCAEKAE